MNKIAKVILITTGSLIAILLLIVVGAHLYVESASVQSRIEVAVSQQVKMPVKASLLRFSLWSGLRVEGLIIGEDPEQPFAKIPEISAKVAWSPLIFSRRLVIRELKISSPDVNWQQDSKGKWTLPHSQKEKKEKKDKKERREEQEPHQEKVSKTASTDKKAKTEKADRQRVEFHIVQARVNGGTFRFIDRKGKTLALLEGVDVSIPLLAADEAHGKAGIERVTLRQKLQIEKISTPFDYQDGALVLSELKAMIAGGSVNGSGTLQPQTDGAPFASKVAFTNVDMGKLLNDLEASGFTKGEGKLHGSLELKGETGEPKSIEGNGRVELKGGRMEQYPLLQMLGQTLQIDELTQLELDQARLVTQIRKGRVYIDDLTLESTNLSITATGNVRFDKKMDLDASLAVNEKISRQLPRLIRDNFRPTDGSDRIALPFKVTGTLEDPDTDLVRALMGEQLERQANTLFRAIRDIAGGGDKDKKKSKDKKRDRDKKKKEKKE